MGDMGALGSAHVTYFPQVAATISSEFLWPARAGVGIRIISDAVKPVHTSTGLVSRRNAPDFRPGRAPLPPTPLFVL